MANKLTVSEILLNLFKVAFGDQFRLYRVGDPITPGQSMLPAIFVTETNLPIEQDATGYDELTHNIFIQVVYNKKVEMGRPTEGNTLDTILDNIVFGRDATTGAYLDNTIVGVLRTNLTVSGLAVNSKITIRKGVVPRPEEMITAEAHIEATITELQAVNNRT